MNLTGLRNPFYKNQILLFTALVAAVLVIGLTGCRTTLPAEVESDVNPGAVMPTLTPAPLPTPSPIPDTSVRGEVVIWMSYGPFELESLRAAVDAFSTKNPDIAFAMAYYPEDQLLDAFQMLGGSGRGPTILIGPSQWGPDLYAQDKVLDLSALIDAELEEEIYPSAWTQVRSEFGVIGLPFELRGVLLYRNRALAGESPATVADWISAQSRIASQEGIESTLDFGFTYSGAFLPTCGAQLEEANYQAQVFGPSGLCWLELLFDLSKNAQIVFNSDQDFDAFIAGSSPWLIDLAERRPQLRSELGESDLVVNPWPVYTPQGLPLRGYMWTDNIYLASGTPDGDLEATWAFARYLLTPEAQTMLSDPAKAGHIPVVSSAELSDPLMVESSAMLRTGVPWPLEFSDQEFLDELESAITNVVQQGSPPEFALNFAQESLGLPITVIPTATTSAP